MVLYTIVFVVMSITEDIIPDHPQYLIGSIAKNSPNDIKTVVKLHTNNKNIIVLNMFSGCIIFHKS